VCAFNDVDCWQFCSTECRRVQCYYCGVGHASLWCHAKRRQHWIHSYINRSE